MTQKKLIITTFLCCAGVMCCSFRRSLDLRASSILASLYERICCFDTGANLDCIDYDLFKALFEMGLVRDLSFYVKPKSLNGTGNGSASIVGWAVVIIAFEGMTLPFAGDIVINLGITGIVGCNSMGRFKTMINLDDASRSIFIEATVVATIKDDRCCRGQSVITVKQLDQSCVPTTRFLGRSWKTSDEAMSGEPNEEFKNNPFTWREDFPEDSEVVNYAMVAFSGEET